LIDIRSTQ